MSINRRFLPITASLTLAAAFSFGLAAGTANADDPKPCKLELKTAKVKAACEKGGINAAKKVMKKLVATAKEKGIKKDGKAINCKSCHTSLKTNALTKDARPLMTKIVKG